MRERETKKEVQRPQESLKKVMRELETRRWREKEQEIKGNGGSKMERYRVSRVGEYNGEGGRKERGREGGPFHGIHGHIWPRSTPKSATQDQAFSTGSYTPEHVV